MRPKRWQKELGYIIGSFCVETWCFSTKVSALTKAPTGVITFVPTALEFLIPGRKVTVLA